MNVEVNHVFKQYANHLALNDVSLKVKEGTVFGLLGPNGAGKSTLIRILNQITAADKGEVLFNGLPIKSTDVERVGYLPEERGLYKKMKVGEQAMYLAQLKGLSKKEAMQRLIYWFKKLELETWWDKKIEELSKGMQQKIQFIITILHEPKLLILDEPFSGFDPINANILKEQILELKSKGTTIILSTHNMGSVEEICDEIALINQSRVVLNGGVWETKQRFKQNIYKVMLEGTLDNEVLQNNEKYSILETSYLPNGTQMKLQLNAQESANTVLPYFMSLGNIIHFEELLPSMNEIFIQQVKGTSNNSPSIL